MKNRSRYVEYNSHNLLLKSWACPLLMQIDRQLTDFYHNDEYQVYKLLDRSSLPSQEIPDDHERPKRIATEYATCEHTTFDEQDLFCVNTCTVASLLHLNETELSAMRFGMLLQSCISLVVLTDAVDSSLSELEAATLIADVLQSDSESVFQALGRSSTLMATGILASGRWWNTSCSRDVWLSMPKAILRQMFRKQESGSAITSALYQSSKVSQLRSRDVRELTDQLPLLKEYLRAAYKRSAAGVNILIHGKQAGFG